MTIIQLVMLKKLIPNFFKKVCVSLKKFAILFDQSKWLKSYITRIEAEKKWWQRRKSILQINKQCYVW